MTTTNEVGAVSWGAVIAGAVGASALSLVLFLLGTGLGLAAVSPWAGEGVSGKAVGVSSVVWITVVQLLAAVLGGYLAGRLRTRWVTVHTDEVFFRDTAHGFLAWAVSTLLVATLLASAVGTALSGGLKAGANAMAATGDERNDGALDYFVDSLFRGDADQARPLPPERAAEAARIVGNAMTEGELVEADRRYHAQLVAAQTGLSRAEADQRIAESYTRLQEGADDARKASAGLALWLVVSLFIGAFMASFAAIYGGRQRDAAVLVRA
jgi:hypothetical protein